LSPSGVADTTEPRCQPAEAGTAAVFGGGRPLPPVEDVSARLAVPEDGARVAASATRALSSGTVVAMLADAVVDAEHGGWADADVVGLGKRISGAFS
jgi:hypothetical protein